jgi:hypothetical protein
VWLASSAFEMKKQTEKSVHALAMTIDQPGQSDVLLGRGTRANKHIGNIRFRTLIRETIGAASKVHDVMMSARKIVQTINERKGRFLKKVQTTRQNGAPDIFVEVPYKVAVEKTRQSFRFQVTAAAAGADNDEKNQKVRDLLPSTNLCFASLVPPRSTAASSMAHGDRSMPVAPSSFVDQYRRRVTDVSSLRLLDPGWSSVVGGGVFAGSIVRFPWRDDVVLNLRQRELQNSAMALEVLDRKTRLVRALQAQRQDQHNQHPSAAYLFY